MYDIVFAGKTQKVFKKWIKSNPQNADKVTALLADIRLHPRTGIGQPEALRGGNGLIYSRRISAKERLIYEIHDNEIYVLIIQVGGHYDDK